VYKITSKKQFSTRGTGVQKEINRKQQFVEKATKELNSKNLKGKKVWNTCGIEAHP